MNLKYFFSVLFLLCIAVSAFAMDIDSVKQELDQDQFFLFLEDYIEKEEGQLTDIPNLSKAYYYYGFLSLNVNHDIDTAKIIFDKGYNFAVEQQDTIGKIIFYRAYGHYYTAKNEMDVAIENYQKALLLAESNAYDDGVSKIYADIARPYYQLENFDVAVEYLLKAYESSQDSILKASLLNNIGIIYKNQKKWDKALFYYFESLVLTKLQRDTIGEAQTLNNIGSVYINQLDYDNAFTYYNRALALDPDNPNLLSNINKWMLDTGSGKADDQINILLGLMTDNVEKNRLKQNLPILETLYNYYEKTGDFEQANLYIKLHNNTYRSIVNESRVAEALKLKEEFESEKKEAEIELLKEKNYYEELSNNQNKVLIVILLALIFFILVAMFFWTRQSLMKQTTQQLLLEQQLMRSQMNPHFIFNAISNIQSFILNEENDLAVEYLGKFSRLTRETLENSAEQYIKLNNEISALTNYIELQKIRFSTLFEYKISTASIDTVNILIPPMLIQPIVENAIEHGLKPLDRKGVLNITLTKDGVFLRCIIEDNGIGRKRAKSNLNKESMSTNITKKRLELLSKRNRQKPCFEIIDLTDNANEPSGTKIIMDIPFKSIIQ